MAGKPNFDESAVRLDYVNLKSSFDNMEEDLINILQDFIMQMPEFKSIVAGEADRSEFANPSEFWESISSNGTVLPELDDLIEYISENYNAKDDGKAEKLVRDLEAVKGACFKGCKESGEQLIKRQQEMIEQNQKIIQEEKEKLSKIEQEVEKLKSKKIDLEAIYFKIPVGDPKGISVESDIEACKEHIKEKEDAINLLTSRT